MSQGKNSFRHESLQDAQSIQGLLKAITKGIAKGRVELRDDGDEILLEPQGLLQLKVTARQDGERNRLDLRITWQSDEKRRDDGSLRVNANSKR